MTIQQDNMIPVAITPNDIFCLFKVELLNKRGVTTLSPKLHEVKFFDLKGKQIEEKQWEYLIEKTQTFNSEQGHNIWKHYTIYRDHGLG